MTTSTYDVVILGTGPAGLQAAIHAVRSKVSVLVLGKQHKSSLYRAHIENYCCLSKVDGETLLQDGRKQAEHFGAQFLDEDAVQIKQVDSWFHLKVESGSEIQCRSLIFALGVFRNKLNVRGEKELLGRGVSYCVDCDANFSPRGTCCRGGLRKRRLDRSAHPPLLYQRGLSRVREAGSDRSPCPADQGKPDPPPRGTQGQADPR